MRRPLLSLLATSLLACDQSPQPTDPAASGADGAEMSAARAKARALRTTNERFQIRELSASADFSTVEGCILTDVFVVGGEEAVKTGPGKAAAGPFASLGSSS